MLKRDKGTKFISNKQHPVHIFFTGIDRPDTAARPESDTGHTIFFRTQRPEWLRNLNCFFIFATQKALMRRAGPIAQSVRAADS